jgi:hypothetical protein
MAGQGARPLRDGVLLSFPALAGEQYVARHLVLAARVVGHLPARDPERRGCIGQAQAVLPAPADELGRIGAPVLFERHLPEPISAHIAIARPDNAMAALADSGARKDSRIAQRAQALQSKHGLVQINAQRRPVKRRVPSWPPRMIDTE